jgi:translocation and assembly module TamB
MQPPATPAPRRSARTRSRLLIWAEILVLVALLALGAALTWLAASASGLRVLAAWAESLAGGRLEVAVSGGSLTGGPRLARLRYDDGETRVALRDLALDWDLPALASGRLEVSGLSATELEIATRPGDDAPPQRPQSLELPLAVNVARAALARLTLVERRPAGEATTLVLEDIGGRLASDGALHRLSELRLAGPWGRAEGQARLDGRAPFALEARVQAAGSREGQAWRLRASAAGRLEDLSVEADADGMDLEGHATARIAPFAAVPLARLEARVAGIDPARFARAAPRAALALELDLQSQSPADGSAALPPQEWVLTGPIRLSNAIPGELDRGLLPLRALAANARWEAGRLGLEDIELLLGAKGRAAGSAVWAQQALSARLEVAELDLRQLAAALKPTRLAGRLEARVSASAQRLVAELREPRFSARFEAEHRAARIEIARARIDARGAGLEARGHVALEGRRAFELSGSLRRFDPSLFAAVPAALLNARIEARGTLEPAPWVDAGFSLADSRFDGKPLAGEGRIALRPDRLERCDVRLDLAGNRLQAGGSFGRAGDRLELSIDAPRLANLGHGLGGTVKAQGFASGSVKQPSFGLEAAAESLVAAGYRVAQATLRAELRDGADGRFELRGRVAGVQQADARDALLPQAGIEIAGTRREHALRAAGRIGSGHDFAVEAAGALGEGPAWAGKLLAFELKGRPELRLVAPASLEVSPERAALGPAELRSDTARALLAETLWSPQAIVSRGTLSGVGLGVAFDARQKPVLTPQGLRLGAEWDLRLADHADGNVRIFREGGDLGLAGDAPVSLGLSTLELRAHAEQDRLGWSLEAAGSRLGELSGAGTALAQRSGTGWRLAPDAPVAGAVRAYMPSIAWLGPWLDPGLQLEGALRGEFAITGSGAAPRGQGALLGEKLGVALVEYGTRLSEGELRLAFDQERLRLERLHFASANRVRPREGRIDHAALSATPGSLEASGDFELVSGRGQLEVEAQRLTVVQRPERWLMVSGSGLFESGPEGMKLGGSVKADAGYWELTRDPAPALSDDVVVKGREAAGGRRLPLAMDVQAQMGSSFYFNGRGLKSRLAGELRVRSDGRGALRGSGSIRTRGGTFDAYGQHLTIERGIVNFQGPLDNPGLNVVALRKNLPVEAGVEVTGTVLAPQVKLVSEPNVPDAEKLSWIVLGRGQDQAGGADAGLLMAAAGAILGGQGEGISAQLARGLGLDELSVVTATSGNGDSRLPTTTVAGGQSSRDASVAQQIVTVGKRLSTDAFLSFEQSLAGAESIVKITYYLTRRLSLIGRAGTDNSIDLFYTYSFN